MEQNLKLNIKYATPAFPATEHSAWGVSKLLYVVTQLIAADCTRGRVDKSDIKLLIKQAKQIIDICDAEEEQEFNQINKTKNAE